MSSENRSHSGRSTIRASVIAVGVLSAIAFAAARSGQGSRASVRPDPTVCYVVNGAMICVPGTAPDTTAVR